MPVSKSPCDGPDRPHLALVVVHAARVGGMETFCRFVARTALAAGWRVTVVLSGDDIYSELYPGGNARLRVDPLDWLDRTFAGDRRYEWPTIRQRRGYFRRVRPDVALFVQTSNTPMRASVAGAYLAGVPIVTTHRTMPWPVEDCPRRRHLFGLIRGVGLHRRRVVAKTYLTAALARRVVYNSEAVRRQYERDYHYPRRKGWVIPNAVEVAHAPGPFSPGWCGMGTGGSADRRAITIGYVGRLGPEKQIDLLLRAVAADCADLSVRLMIVGDGPDRERLQSLAARLAIDGRIDWRGPTAEVGLIYRQCDLVALCSRRESSSNMVLEAMAAGKAVVVPRVGGLPELVGEGRWGVCVPPNDVGELGSALRRLVLHDAHRRELGERARQAARLRHDPCQIGAAWLALLRGTARRPVKPLTCPDHSATGGTSCTACVTSIR